MRPSFSGGIRLPPRIHSMITNNSLPPSKAGMGKILKIARLMLNNPASGIRIIAPMPGKGTVGIEVPNSNPDIVSMRALIASDKFQNTLL